MLLQTNSYIVPNEKRTEHGRLMRRFRQALLRLGCDSFEVYEQVGANWSPLKEASRFVQMLRFRDRQHHQAIEAAERKDPAAQELIRQFAELIDLEYQKENGLFVIGYYSGMMAYSGALAAPPVSAAEAPAAQEEKEEAESRDFTTADHEPQDQRQSAARFRKRSGNEVPEGEAER